MIYQARGLDKKPILRVGLSLINSSSFLSGYSPPAKIPSPFACQASLTIFGRGMRTPRASALPRHCGLRAYSPARKNDRSKPVVFSVQRLQKRYFGQSLIRFRTQTQNHAIVVDIINAKHCISPTACRCISSLRKRIQPAADGILALSRYTRQGG